MTKISVERLQELFVYDPEEGTITRLIDCGKAAAGFVFHEGVIWVDGVCLPCSHVAWTLHHGYWPPEGYCIDHKNGIRANNCLVNLRLATRSQNNQNRGGRGQYSKGVTWHTGSQRRPWRARIKQRYLGRFETEEAAAEAYRQAALQYHGEFACLE